MSGLGLDEFLDHEPTGGGGRGTFLRGWKKRSDKAVNTWLHTRAKITPLWQHNWPRINEFEDRDTKETKREVWGGSVNCIEPEHILKKQYRRDDDTDEREVPPGTCPHCLLVEELRRMVRDQEVALHEPAFKYIVDNDDEHARILTVGGLFNAFNSWDKLDEDVRKAAKKAGISPKHAWKENTYAKCNYLFLVVDNDSTDDGIQIAIETTLLGDKVKDAIRKYIKQNGDEDGNPLKNPYCIRWEHHPSESEFGKKYDALAMPKIVLTDEVRELIFNEDPPDVGGIIAPPNVKTLLATMQRYALIDLDWDRIFGPALKAADAGGNLDDGGGEKGEPTDDGGSVGPADDDDDGKSISEHIDDAKNEASSASSEDVYGCDVCEADMKGDEFVCKKCTAEYDKDGNLTMDPRKKKPKEKKKRSAAGATPTKPVDDDDIPF